MTSLEVLLAVLTLAVMTFGIVVPLIIGVIQLKKRFDWEKGMLASQLGNMWSEKTLEHRQIIEQKYGPYLVKSEPISPPDAAEFVGATEGELYQVKIAVISLLNYFEDIAVLYLSGMADRLIIDETIRRPMMRYYDKVRPLAKCIDHVAGYCSWKPLDDLVNLWKREDSDRKQLKVFRYYSLKKHD